MPGPKILAFAGSTRTGSNNRKVLNVAIEGAREAGGDVTLLDLADYRMPLYDGDLEASEGLPENARKLRQIFSQHQALLLGCPEYNSSVTPLLKNTIDWVSRPTKDEPSLKYISGKLAALVSTGGGLGGLRGLFHVRDILLNIGVTVLPDQFAVPMGAAAFDEAGKLKNEAQTVALKNVGRKLAEAANKLYG
jgi:NAD(P)H-dependent FMN reductase